MKIKWVDVWEAIKVPSILATVVVVLPPICHITCSSSHQWPISPSPSCALHVTAGLSSSLIHALSGCSPLLWYVSQPFSASGHAVVHASQVNLSLLHHDFALQLLEATKKPGNLHLTRLHIWPTLRSCWGSHEFCICQLRASTSGTQVLSCFLQSPSFSELLDQKHRTHLSFSWPALFSLSVKSSSSCSTESPPWSFSTDRSSLTFWTLSTRFLRVLLCCLCQCLPRRPLCLKCHPSLFPSAYPVLAASLLSSHSQLRAYLLQRAFLTPLLPGWTKAHFWIPLIPYVAFPIVLKSWACSY